MQVATSDIGDDLYGALAERFGEENYARQQTRTGMPVIWVDESRLIETLTFLRDLSAPFTGRSSRLAL